MSKASDAALRHHAARRVEAFHDAFEVKAGTIGEAAERRATLHYEEGVELREALDALSLADPDLVDTHRALVARELADVMVVAYGTADLLDIDLDAAFDAVMDANMAKLLDCEECKGSRFVITATLGTTRCPACHGTGKGKPVKRADGKVLKPEGWTAPDLSAAFKAVRAKQAEIIQRGIEGICTWNGIEYDRDDVGRKARGMLDAVLGAALAPAREVPDGAERSCPKSERDDHDHCEHSCSHERCCWCGKEWGDEDADERR